MVIRGAATVAIECLNLSRIYTSGSLLRQKREIVAVDNLNLQIPKGIVFGLLGPNGAGKTTTIRILSTLLTPTTGSARVLGYDVLREARQVRRHIGLVLGGERGLYGRLTGKQNLEYYAALHHMNPRDAKQRAETLLNHVGLAQAADTLVEQYSRGMKQRLHLARGLLTDPDVLFLDEPTIGLDPQGASEIRKLIPQLAAQGKTVLLTTHYMSEADLLCDVIAIINQGRLVALGNPSEIKHQFSQISVTEVTLKQIDQGVLDRIATIEQVKRIDVAGADGGFPKYLIFTVVGADVRQQVIGAIGEGNVAGIFSRDPNLEEAYLNIIREVSHAGVDAGTSM